MLSHFTNKVWSLVLGSTQSYTDSTNSSIEILLKFKGSKVENDWGTLSYEYFTSLISAFQWDMGADWVLLQDESLDEWQTQNTSETKGSQD